MAVFILVYLLLTKTIVRHTKEKAFVLRRLFLRYANFILGIKTDVTGSIPKETALYVSNHRSLSDPLILCNFLDAYVIAKAEVAKYPIISTGARLTGILYVQREEKTSRRAVREKMKETLLLGANVLVYPEGTVNYKKNTLPYKAGTFKEVSALNIPIVPVCLEYKRAKDIWCKRSMFEHFILQFGHLTTVTRLVIGEPMLDEDGEYLREKCEDWTNQTIHKIHSDWNSVFTHQDSVEEQTSGK